MRYRRSRKRPLWVWDPSQFNPYGRELARVIALNHRDVTHICRPVDTDVADITFRTWKLLPAPAQGKRDMITSAKYLTALLRFVAWALTIRPLLVIPWVNGRIEAVTFSVLQRFGLKTILIVHNPTVSRDNAPTGSCMQRLRYRATRIVTHTSALASLLPQRLPVVVAHHPAYLDWAKRMRANEAKESTVVRHGQLRLLYAGAAREDKGFFSLPALSRAALGKRAIVVICIGRLNEAQRTVLAACQGAEIAADGERYVEDEELFRQMSSSDVLVAPYTDVTVSGTIILAMTLGLPVVAYESPELHDLLPLVCLARPGDLDDLISRAFAAMSKENVSELGPTIARLDEQSADDWRLLLNGVS